MYTMMSIFVKIQYVCMIVLLNIMTLVEFCVSFVHLVSIILWLDRVDDQHHIVANGVIANAGEADTYDLQLAQHEEITFNIQSTLPRDAKNNHYALDYVIRKLSSTSRWPA